MTIDELLRSILNPHPGGNQLAQAGAGYLPQTGLAPDQVARFHQMSGLGSPQAAPQASAAPSPPPQSAAMPQAAPTVPQAAPQGNEGGVLSRLFGGRQDTNPALNETASWLERQGYDPGTARALAGNKEAMQRILVGQVGGNKPIEINGRLVDPKDYHVLADFSDKSGGDKLPTSYQEFELAKQDGFKGTYTDWQTKSVREQDPTFGRELDLSKEYNSEQTISDYNRVRSQYERIREGAKAGTGSGDIAMVFSYMKMLDPTSTVARGEQANAENAAGVPGQLASLYNNLIGGGSLGAVQRKQMLEAADAIYGEVSTNVKDINKRYTSRAAAWKLDPAHFVVDPESYAPFGFYSGDDGSGTPPPPPGTNPNILQPAPAQPAPAQPAPDDWREVAPGVRLRKVN